MKKLYVLLAAMLLTAAVPTTAYSRDLDSYYYEEDDYASYDDGWEDYCPNGVVYENGGAIHISGGSVRMTVGDVKDLAKNRSYTSADEDKEVRVVSGLKWSSDNPAVASVDSKGVVTANKIGSTRIVISYTDNRGYSIAQTVRLTVGTGSGPTAAVTEQYFEVAEGYRVYLGDLLPASFDPKNTKWSSGKEKIATVDSDGLVLAHSIGKCTITATYIDGSGEQQTASFSIRVTSGILENSKRDINIVLPVGADLDIVKMVFPNYISGNALKDMKLTSSDSHVISLNGYTIQALKTGNATVTVKRYEGDEVRESQTVSIKVS